MVAKGERGEKQTNICKRKVKRMSCNQRVAENKVLLCLFPIHSLFSQLSPCTEALKPMIYCASSDEKLQFRVVCGRHLCMDGKICV